jgi:hypothetical protein
VQVYIPTVFGSPAFLMSKLISKSREKHLSLWLLSAILTLSRSSLKRDQNVDDVAFSSLFSPSLTRYLDKVQNVSNDAGGAKGSTAKMLFFASSMVP